MCFLLAGCGAQPTLETVADEQILPAGASVQQVLLELPKGAQLQTMGPDSLDQLYLCDGFTVSVQTMEAGDLDRTLRSTRPHVHAGAGNNLHKAPHVKPHAKPHADAHVKPHNGNSNRNDKGQAGGSNKRPSNAKGAGGRGR